MKNKTIIFMYFFKKKKCYDIFQKKKQKNKNRKLWKQNKKQFLENYSFMYARRFLLWPFGDTISETLFR